jgi:hypothetical protein
MTQNSSPNQHVEESLESFESITEDEAAEIANRLRVETTSGSTPLNTVLLDIIVGQNEVEQYRQGALTLVSNLDARIEEEKQRDPDSDAIEVLQAVRDEALELADRIDAPE